MKPENPEKVAVTGLDIRMGISVAICTAVAHILNNVVGIKLSFGGRQMEILQLMTACICCIMCCQDNVTLSSRAGKNRIIITVVGGLVGMAVTALDNAIGHGVWMILLVPAGVVVTLLICRACKVPAVTGRIGAVTFILVSCTLSGSARFAYGVLRLVSTVFGVLVTLLVTGVMTKLKK